MDATTRFVLQVLPSGLAVPPLPYLVGMAVAAGIVGFVLYSREPPVTEGTVVNLAPWMVAGAAGHALFQLDAVPALLAPLVAAPAVYLVTAVAAGGVWSVLDAGLSDQRRVARALGASGTVLAVVLTAVAVQWGLARGRFSPLVPVVGLLATLVLAGVVVVVLRQFRARDLERTGAVGVLVVLGHALDGVSTAIGVDLLGSTERSPIPQAIMEFAGTLPTAAVIGQGWLFVLVKVAVAAGAVVLFADFVEDEPTTGNLTLGLVAAVGLGPGAQNLILFSVA